MNFPPLDETFGLNLSQVVFHVQRTEPVTTFAIVYVAEGGVRQWRRETIQMPVGVASIACDKLPLASCRSTTRVAEDSHAFRVFGFEQIQGLIVSDAVPMLISFTQLDEQETNLVLTLTASVKLPSLAVPTLSK